MLDLKLLEQRLDAQLQAETPESLSAWLNSRRAAKYQAYLGEGDFENLDVFNQIIEMPVSQVYNYAQNPQAACVVESNDLSHLLFAA